MSVAGHLKSGEAADIALQRELIEESGLQVDHVSLTPISRVISDSQHTICSLFIVEVEQGTEIVLDPTEHSDGAWVPIKELRSYIQSDPTQHKDSIDTNLALLLDLIASQSTGS